LIAETIGDWSERRVLVTGAAGLLGRSVSTELLDRRGTVFGLDIAWPGRGLGDPAGFSEVPGDVRDRTLLDRVLREERVDTVIHLAAQTLVGPAVGATIIVLLKNLVSVYTHRWLLILGVVYIGTIVYAPEGIVGAMRQWTRRVTPGPLRSEA